MWSICCVASHRDRGAKASRGLHRRARRSATFYAHNSRSGAMLRQFGCRHRNTEPSVKRSRSSDRLRKRCDRKSKPRMPVSPSRRRAVRPACSDFSAQLRSAPAVRSTPSLQAVSSPTRWSRWSRMSYLSQNRTRQPWPRRVPPAFHALAFDWTRLKAIAPYALGPAGRRAKVEQCAHPFF